MTPAEIKKLISQLLEPFNWRDVAQVQQRVELMQDAADALAAQQERVEARMIPKEVLDFYNFCDAAFVPFTSQQEELMKSLKLARKAMAAAQRREGEKQ